MWLQMLFPLALLYCSNILLTVYAIAPNDANPFCTTSSIHPPPVHPPNTRILLDTYHYINLLLPHDGPVWQMVDNDRNNVAGRGTSWTQNTNTPCRQRINVCGFSGGPQNNWLITQYIRRPTLDVTQVSILVEFEMVGCTDRSCEKTFVLNKLETSDSSGANANDTSRYQTITRVATTDDTGLMRQNGTEEMDFDTEAEGFHLAIVDEGTCIGVSRVIVFYSVCPAGVVNLVNRAETLAPRFERLSQPFEVTVECVEGARPENEMEARLNCNQGGRWTEVQGSGCRCNPGLRSDGGESCEGCDVGMYLSPSQGICLPCPANSVSLISGVSVCPCVSGFFRAPGEEEEPCTKPPSRIQNLLITSTSSTTISLAWDPPNSFGGRNDTVYSLWYQKQGSNVTVIVGTISDLKRTITSLLPHTQYVVFVAAMNGVSNQTERDNIVSVFAITEGCDAGMYLSSSQGICLPCPANTVSSISEVSVCPCVSGYFRELGEEEKPCTQSSPSHILIVAVIILVIVVLVLAAIVIVFVIFCFTRKTKKVPIPPIYETVDPPSLPPRGETEPVKTKDDVGSRTLVFTEDNVAYVQNIVLQDNAAYGKI